MTRPTPTHLKLLRGNPGKRAINRREPKPPGDLREPPPDLPAPARPYWWQAVNQSPPGLLKRIDGRVVALWATAAWLHARAAAELANGALMEPDENRAPRKSPLLAVLNHQAAIMLRAGAELGFSPSSRTRLAIAPEAPDEGFDEFR